MRAERTDRSFVERANLVLKKVPCVGPHTSWAVGHS